MGAKVNRAELLQVLGRVMPGISKRGTISQSNCFIFREGWLSTFNDEICCRTQSGLPAELEVAVLAEKMVKWLELVPDDEVEITVESGQFKMRAGRKKCAIRAEVEIVLPIDEVDTPESWRLLPDDFFRGIEQVMGTAAGASGEFMERCVHIHPDYVEACDRKQATRYELTSGVTQSFLVQAATIAHTINLGLTKIGETNDWVHFRNKTLIFSCRRHIENYPTEGIKRMLAFRGEPCVLPKGAELAAKLGQVFTAEDKENDRVDVQLRDGHMIIRGDGNHGWASDDIDMTYQGEPVAFRLSPLQLIQLVRNANSCEIGPGKLRIVGDKWSYITVLGKPGADDDKVKAAVQPRPDDSDTDEGDEDNDD